MSTNGTNHLEDAEMAEYDGEKVVTMMDVLQEEQDFEDDANAVLGASDEKNCTYSKGYIKRQAIYACLTCCFEAKDDPTKRAGVCLACSLNCHENHELVELYTKRNFRCDCGNPKFNSHPCQFTPDKNEYNDENYYNQNFSGLYCNCHRPYPDPEATIEDEEMIQCIICEDWLHASHLDAVVPTNDQYSEMICKACMETNEFLHDYSNLTVNVEIGDVDIVTVNGTASKLNNSELEIEKIVNGVDVDVLPKDFNEKTETDMNIDDQQSLPDEKCEPEYSDTLQSQVPADQSITNECIELAEKVQNTENQPLITCNENPDDKMEEQENSILGQDSEDKQSDSPQDSQKNLSSENGQSETEMIKESGEHDSKKNEEKAEQSTNNTEIENSDKSSVTNMEQEIIKPTETMDELSENVTDKLEPVPNSDNGSVRNMEQEIIKPTETKNELSENVTDKLEPVPISDNGSVRNMEQEIIKPTETKDELSENVIDKLEPVPNSDNGSVRNMEQEIIKPTETMDELSENVTDKLEPAPNSDNGSVRNMEQEIIKPTETKDELSENVIEKLESVPNSDNSYVRNMEQEIIKPTETKDELSENVLEKLEQISNLDPETSVMNTESIDAVNSSEPNSIDNKINEEYIESAIENCNNISNENKTENIESNNPSDCVEDDVSKVKSTEISKDILNIEEPITINEEIKEGNNSDLNNKQPITNEGDYEDLNTKDSIPASEVNEGNNSDNKRKLSTEDSVENTTKKPKLDNESKCIRPVNVKRVHKGATFWPPNFRQKLCTCSVCLSMYKDLSVLFLIDPEDTVCAYETLGKERVGGRATQYEKGLEALSSLGRIEQINALTEYNKMKDKLLDFLKSFKDRKEIVKEEDIKAFFAGMKPKREPDGVYFCR